VTSINDRPTLIPPSVAATSTAAWKLTSISDNRRPGKPCTRIAVIVGREGFFSNIYTLTLKKKSWPHNESIRRNNTICSSTSHVSGARHVGRRSWAVQNRLAPECDGRLMSDRRYLNSWSPKMVQSQIFGTLCDPLGYFGNTILSMHEACDIRFHSSGSAPMRRRRRSPLDHPARYPRP